MLVRDRMREPQAGVVPWVGVVLQEEVVPWVGVVPLVEVAPCVEAAPWVEVGPLLEVVPSVKIVLHMEFVLQVVLAPLVEVQGPGHKVALWVDLWLLFQAGTQPVLGQDLPPGAHTAF